MKRLMSLLLCAAFLGASGANSVSGASASGANSASGAREPKFTIATAPYVFTFPRDHAAHPDYQSEWWYYTGHLRTPGGRRFGYELTFFRFGLRPGDPPVRAGRSRWRGRQLYPAHFAITDERGRAFFYTEQFAREALGMGGASTQRLAVHAGGWTLEGEPLADGRFERMRLRAASGGAALDLVQTPLKPPAVHGSGGISRKAACASCASHYYSYTRLATRGSLTYGGARFAVEGQSWMDHEYGTSELQPDQAGWDWFSVQLNDGREVMLYLLRRKDGSVTPESSGSLIERDGSVRHVPLQAFAVAVPPGARWRSPHTGAQYPDRWRVTIPAAGLDLRLTPTVADQELASTTGGVSYWEGAVEVKDANDMPAGAGYVELTGYAGGVSL
jgi:predicted secreted hydrolase